MLKDAKPFQVFDEIPLLTPVGGIAVFVNIIGLYATPWVSVCVFAFVGLCLFMLSSLQADGSKLKTAGEWLLFGAVFLALIVGALVGPFHTIDFKPAALVAVALLSIAAVVLIIGGSPRGIAILFVAVALAIVVYKLPAPPGSPENDPDRHITTLLVHVRSLGAKKGVDQAVSNVDVGLHWRNEGLPNATGGYDQTRTNESGRAQFQVIIEPEGKVFILDASTYEKYEHGYFGPAHAEVHDIKRGETRSVEITLPWLSVD